ncbi:hypothetical protein Q73_03130 [Bacillus coahuilensis m2-6]|uniref:hypothetical protein n=1 Tax=Bacillus coahuilensis TaxID=408580 RepID=UPI0007506437|nr:hypothetical protein [Bacillus coahuilensis]KUP09285.1 hypothetical protein Q73_03130 [Bacillus coahuilensis m2-6]
MRKSIFFISKDPTRCVMAKGWASKLPSTKWTFQSGGASTGILDELPKRAMYEVNLPIPEEIPSIHDVTVQEAHHVIWIRDKEAGETLPPLLEKASNVISWDIKNPSFEDTSYEEQHALYQEICDDIALKVLELSHYLLPH